MKKKQLETSSPLTVKDTYELINTIADQAWGLVQFWSIFSQTIIGNNLITALDKASISLAKAGRNKTQKKVNQNIEETLEYILESLLWCDKARRRKLFSNQDYQHLYTKLRAVETVLTKQLKAAN